LRFLMSLVEPMDCAERFLQGSKGVILGRGAVAVDDRVRFSANSVKRIPKVAQFGVPVAPLSAQKVR
jgi:hypothetical protein